MKVLLLRDVKGVGRKDEIIDVSDGYGRNFLIARNYGVVATDLAVKNAERMEKRKLESEKKEQVDIVVFTKILNDNEIVYYVPTGDKDQLFRQINGSLVENAVRDEFRAFNYLEFNCNLDKPIKSTGEYKIPIVFKYGIKSTVKFVVKPEKERKERPM